MRYGETDESHIFKLIRSIVHKRGDGQLGREYTEFSICKAVLLYMKVYVFRLLKQFIDGKADFL